MYSTYVELFENKVRNTAQTIVNQGHEYLSDTEVELLYFDPEFRNQVERQLRAMQHSPPVLFFGATENKGRFDSYGVTLPRYPGGHSLGLLVDRVLDRRSSCYSHNEIISWATVWNMPLERVRELLSAFQEMERGIPLPAGEVEYSKRASDAFKLVSYERNADGSATFREKEFNDVRWFAHETSDPEHQAADLLLRLGWSGSQIVVDDFMNSMTAQQEKPAGQPIEAPRKDELETLWAVLQAHTALAASLVRSMGLDIDSEDLKQDVALQICLLYRNGGRLRDGAAAHKYMQSSLRNKANSHVRRRNSRPRMIQESEVLLELFPARGSEETQRAFKMLNAVRPRLSSFGCLALACSLGECNLDTYALDKRCSKRTARRHFVKGITELASALREVAADLDCPT
jgi:DNA-directed RNA polymerase specialized sigma24 family protein